MIKLSQEPCTKQDFPSLNTIQKPLTQGHFEPSGSACVFFNWKEQKNNGLVELLLHVLKQMYLSLGMGRCCPETAQILPQRHPGGQAHSQVTAGWAAFYSGHKKYAQFCAPGTGIMYVSYFAMYKAYFFAQSF